MLFYALMGLPYWRNKLYHIIRQLPLAKVESRRRGRPRGQSARRNC